MGRLFNLNQLVLEKIGVGCPAADQLIEAALTAGAFGAKISGSGGGLFGYAWDSGTPS